MSEYERGRRDGLEQAAQAVQQWSDGWKSRIAKGMYQGNTLQCADVRRDEGADLAKHVRKLAATSGTPAPATTPTRLAELIATIREQASEMESPYYTKTPSEPDWDYVAKAFREIADDIAQAAAPGGKEPQHDGPCYEEGMLEGLEYAAKFADKFKVEGLDLSVLAEEIRKLKCQVFPQENKEKSDG